MTKEARNGDQRTKEHQEAQKGQEEGKVKERHVPSFQYEINTSHKV
jgi:hypothetical protein